MILNEVQERLYQAMLKYFAIRDKLRDLDVELGKLKQSQGDALYEINQVITHHPEVFEGVKTKRG